MRFWYKLTGMWYRVAGVLYALFTTRFTGSHGRLEAAYGTQLQNAYSYNRSDKGFCREVKRYEKMYKKGLITDREFRELEKAALYSRIMC